MLPQLKPTAHTLYDAGRVPPGDSVIEKGVIGQQLKTLLTSGSEKVGSVTFFHKTYTYNHVSWVVVKVGLRYGIQQVCWSIGNVKFLTSCSSYHHAARRSSSNKLHQALEHFQSRAQPADLQSQYQPTPALSDLISWLHAVKWGLLRVYLRSAQPRSKACKGKGKSLT